MAVARRSSVLYASAAGICSDVLSSDKQVENDWCSSGCFECAHRAFTFLAFVIWSSFVSKLSNLIITNKYRIYNVGPIFIVADKMSTFVQK